MLLSARTFATRVIEHKHEHALSLYLTCVNLLILAEHLLSAESLRPVTKLFKILSMPSTSLFVR